MSASESKRPRGRPRKIAFGSPDVPPPRLVVPSYPQPELRLSKAHRAVIHSIAREAEISPAIVLKDVINQGVPQVEAMYADLIECRRRLEERNSSNNNGRAERSNERPLSQTTDLGDSGAGRVTQEFDSGLGPSDNDAHLERGFQGEGEAAIEAYSSDDRVVSYEEK